MAKKINTNNTNTNNNSQKNIKKNAGCKGSGGGCETINPLQISKNLPTMKAF